MYAKINTQYTAYYINMKKILIACITLLSIAAYGQQEQAREIRVGKYVPNVNAFGSIIIRSGEGRLHYYYDNNDEKVLHGNRSGFGKVQDWEGYYRDQAGNDYGKIYTNHTYSEDMNYVDGELNGPASMTYEKTVKRDIDVSPIKKYNVQIKGMYNKGVPDGLWEITVKDGNKVLVERYSYSNGSVVKYRKTVNGKVSVTAEKTVAGRWNYKAENIDVKNGIKKGAFIGYNGKARKAEAEQNAIIAKIVSNEYNADSLLTVGYGIGYTTTLTVEGADEVLTFMKKISGDIGLDKYDKYVNFDVSYSMLSRADTATWDDVKTICDNSNNPEELLTRGYFRIDTAHTNLYVTSKMKERGLEYVAGKRKLAHDNAKNSVLDMTAMSVNKKVETNGHAVTSESATHQEVTTMAQQNSSTKVKETKTKKKVKSSERKKRRKEARSKKSKLNKDSKTKVKEKKKKDKLSAKEKPRKNKKTKKK